MLGRILLALVLSSGVAAAHDKFPMTGSAYRETFDKKLARYRTRLEAKLTEHKLADDKRAVARKRLASIEVELKKLVDKAVADDVVTETEAEGVKTRGKELRNALYKELGIK